MITGPREAGYLKKLSTAVNWNLFGSSTAGKKPGRIRQSQEIANLSGFTHEKQV